MISLCSSYLLLFFRILQSYPLDPVLKRFPFLFLSNPKRPLEFRKGCSTRTLLLSPGTGSGQAGTITVSRAPSLERNVCAKTPVRFVVVGGCWYCSNVRKKLLKILG